MQRNRVYCVYMFFGLAFSLTHCTPYIDAVRVKKKIPIYQGHLTYYTDSNTLVSKSNVGIRRDSERFNAKPFYTKLPKGLVSYQFSNAETFALYYKEGQAVAIVIDLSDSASKENTTYEPTKPEMEKYLTHFTTDDKQKFNMQNISYHPERKHLIIKKGAATILLYNILPDDNTLFISCLETFKFL